MAANKIAALLVMCLVLVAAVQVPQATADDSFGNCYKDCYTECQNNGNGETFCEMECDTDCSNMEVASKLHIEP